MSLASSQVTENSQHSKFCFNLIALDGSVFPNSRVLWKEVGIRLGAGKPQIDLNKVHTLNFGFPFLNIAGGNNFSSIS